jgi:hypothetical protein
VTLVRRTVEKHMKMIHSAGRLLARTREVGIFTVHQRGFRVGCDGGSRRNTILTSSTQILVLGLGSHRGWLMNL